MLMVRRSDLSGLLGTRLPATVRDVLVLVIELDRRCLPRVDLGLEGVRVLRDVWDGDGALDVSDATGRLFRDLGAGN